MIFWNSMSEGTQNEQNEQNLRNLWRFFKKTGLNSSIHEADPYYKGKYSGQDPRFLP